MRSELLTQTAPRPIEAVLSENRGFYAEALAKANRRLTPEGQEEMTVKLEKAVADAQGSPGLIAQQANNYVRNEALVRAYATSFGEIVTEGSADTIPEYTTLAPASVSVYSVAVSNGRGGSRRRKRYVVTHAQSKGTWKEILTEPVELDFPNPFFSRQRAIVEARAADEIAYRLKKEIDSIAWTSVTNAVAAFTIANVYLYRDTSVVGLPTTNTYTSTKGFWPTLREKVLPHFIGADMADRIINVFYRNTDIQYLYQVAGIGTQSLGQYTTHQEKVYEGNVAEIVIYGHRFRLIPVNWNIASGTLYANVGPVFKMWLPRDGYQTVIRNRDDGSQVRWASQVYEILSPAPYFPRLLYTTYSTSDTSA